MTATNSVTHHLLLETETATTSVTKAATVTTSATRVTEATTTVTKLNCSHGNKAQLQPWYLIIVVSCLSLKNILSESSLNRSSYTFSSYYCCRCRCYCCHAVHNVLTRSRFYHEHCQDHCHPVVICPISSTVRFDKFPLL